MIDHLRDQLKKEGSLNLWLKVHAGASRTCVREFLPDGTIKIDIATKPEKGKANAALIRYLSELFDVPQNSVKILRGETGRKKQVEITL